MKPLLHRTGHSAVAFCAALLLVCGDENIPDNGGATSLPGMTGTFSGMIPKIEYNLGDGDTLRLDTMYLNLVLDSTDSAHLFTVADTGGSERYRNEGRWSVTSDTTIVFIASECFVDGVPVDDSLAGLCAEPVGLKIINEDSLLVTFGSLTTTALLLGYDLETLLEGALGQLVAEFGFPLVREE